MKRNRFTGMLALLLSMLLMLSSCQFAFAAAPAVDPSDRSYQYNETPAQSVTVYVTVSADGVPLQGNDEDETVLSHMAVSVPYFDLDLYDLADFYRYATENGYGGYVGTEVIQRPTALHLYIYLLERYYMGLPENQCGKGIHSPLSDSGNHGVRDFLGNDAYEDSLDALQITGGATSMYMKNFWGHDENLMYYRNHVYPLQSPGWGSTADYMLLQDNDTIDLAMFSNWDFYNYGAFCCFGTDGQPIDTFETTAGKSVRFEALKFGTQSVSDGGTDAFEPMDGLTVQVYDADWNHVADVAGKDGKYTYCFAQPGTYYLLGLDPNMASTDACYAPATAKVEVGENPCADGHHYDSGKVTRQPTCTAQGEMTYTCTVCGDSDTQPVSTTGHKLAAKINAKATLKADGCMGYSCSICGDVAKTVKIIHKVDSVKLSSTSYTYNGKVKKPTVTVKDSKGNVLKKDTDYTVTYDKGRTAVGTYKVTVKGKDKYSFTKTLTFKINPAATKIVSAANKATKSIKVKWNKVSGVTGYQVSVGSKTVTVKGAATVSKTVSKLSKNKTYKVKVRSYKTVSGKNYYSAWSACKSVKITK